MSVFGELHTMENLHNTYRRIVYILAKKKDKRKQKMQTAEVKIFMTGLECFSGDIWPFTYGHGCSKSSRYSMREVGAPAMSFSEIQFSPIYTLFFLNKL